jgi:tripartite-type tricarboxylate transporter receptor subunit TctC
MKRMVGALLVLLFMAQPAKAVRGVDEVYKKPAHRKTWGRLIADYVGYEGYTKSYALIIGISTYDNYRNLPTRNDPIRFKDYLFDEAGFDYVHLLTEEKATSERIRELMIDEFPRLIDRNDRFLLYWSGHGLTRQVSGGARGYLPLKSTPQNKFSKMINMDDLRRWDGLLKAEQTLYLLDSCFSGLAGTSVQSDLRRLTIEQLARPSRQIMTAGTAGQQTIAIDQLGGSIFTTAVLDGLRGAADTTSAFESDGLVSLNELEDYVVKRVAIERRRFGWKASITPQLRDLAVNEGEFFFLTGEHKVSRLASRGLQPSDNFEFGEPVPMSPKDQPDVSPKPPAVEPSKKFPIRDITAVVVWGAGGGTDTCNRIIHAEMAKFLGVNINVINKRGGVGGSVGMNYAYSRKHDGYTLCGLSDSTVIAGVLGGWKNKFDVWDTFIVGGSPDVISVYPDSMYRSLSALIETAKVNPRAIKAAASGAGSIHHLNLRALEKGTGAQFSFIPYKGSAPSQNAALSGEVTVVITSLAEQQQLLRGGKLRALAMLTPESFGAEMTEDYWPIGTIPSAFDAYPGLSEYLPIPQAIGFAVPADTPEGTKAVLVDAFNKAMATDKVKSWARDNYYLLSGRSGAEANAVFADLESNFAWTLWELGAAKVWPKDLGIPQP